ncbi:MAG TPA: HAD family hydrolase [Solirubrobacterales bacterium]|nr:HAD family hydrolase [Solirubrobacterales bacterium]
MAPPVKAVTFDFWNTIACEPPGTMAAARQRAVAAACEACDIEVEAELLATSLEEVVSSYQGSWSAGTHFHPREGAAMLVGALGVEGAAREMVAEAFLTAGRDANLKLSPDIRPCLAALAERGIRLGIVCDVGFTGGELLRGFLDREGLLEYFSGWAFSDEVGHYKPSPQIFEAALDVLGARPADAVHVGDLRRTDVAGARAIGMTTVRYRGLHDDSSTDGGEEAEFVVDSHRDLPDLIAGVAGSA